MAQYYTLEEAAQVLQTTTEEVRQLAEQKTVRAFRDRGTLRFRAQEIDELARERGLGSDPELQFGELPPPKSGSSGSGKRSKTSKPTSSKSSRSSSSSSKSRRRKSKKAPDEPVEAFEELPPVPETEVPLGEDPPPQRPGSDSEVRLVTDGSDLELALGQSDDVLETMDSPPPAPDSGPIPRDEIEDEAPLLIPADDQSDSDVKIVPDDSDDDIVAFDLQGGDGPSDSNVRIEPADLGSSDELEPLVTEEFDLDAEMEQVTGSSGTLPTTSPFELSEDDLDIEEEEEVTPTRETHSADIEDNLDSSDDFELTPTGAEELDQEDVELTFDDDDDSDEIDLGELGEGAGQSGINLLDPADSGISLEQESSDQHEVVLGGAMGEDSHDPLEESSDSEFELTLDDDSDSEFELTLGDEDDDEVEITDESSSEFELELGEEDSSSEFELGLDDDGESSSEFELELGEEDSSSEFELELGDDDDMELGEDSDSEFELELSVEDSDSEFELTLDSSGDMELVDEDEDDKDIFATDFDVPALDDESGSEAIALDEETDLDDESDFDLAIDEDDYDEYDEDESGSQVVALEDDEDFADEEESTVARPSRSRDDFDDDFDIEEDDGHFAGIDDEAEEELEEGEVREVLVYRDRPAAPWGPLPVIFMLPCMIILLVVGLMGFEMLQAANGYKKSRKVTSLIINPIAEAMGMELPKDD